MEKKERSGVEKILRVIALLIGCLIGVGGVAVFLYAPLTSQPSQGMLLGAALLAVGLVIVWYGEP